MKTQRGFTLLEILVVAAILALVLAGLGAAFVSAYKTWDRQRNEITAMISSNVVLERMTRDIATAHSVGDENEKSFTLRYGLAIDADAAQNSITYQIKLNKLLRQSGADDPVTVLDGLAESNFYFDAPPPNTRHIIVDLTIKPTPLDAPVRFWTGAALRFVKISDGISR